MVRLRRKTAVSMSVCEMGLEASHLRKLRLMSMKSSSVLQAIQSSLIWLAELASNEAKARIESIRATLKSDPQNARFVSDRGTGSDDGFPSQVAKVYEELTGKKLAPLMHKAHRAPRAHARSHSLASV